LTGHTDNIRAVCVSPDGELILSGSSDTTIKLWSLTAGRCISTYTYHADSVWCLYSDHPRFNYFYSGGKDGLIAKTMTNGVRMAVPAAPRPGAPMPLGPPAIQPPTECESVALAREPRGIVSLVAVGQSHVWTATTAADVSCWRDIRNDQPQGLADPTGAPTTCPPASLAAQLLDTAPAPVPSSTVPFPHLDDTPPSPVPPAAYLGDRWVSGAPESAPVYPHGSSDLHAYTLNGEPVGSLTEDGTDPNLDSGSLAVVRAHPDAVIEGNHGLVRCTVLNDKFHVIALDTAGDVSLWDLMRCRRVRSLGPLTQFAPPTSRSVRFDSEPPRSVLNEAWERCVEQLNTDDVLQAWCVVDTKIGALSVHLDIGRCFDTEQYADLLLAAPLDEVDDDAVGRSPAERTLNRIHGPTVLDSGRSDLPMDQRMNVGRWVLRYLFEGYTDTRLTLGGVNEALQRPFTTRPPLGAAVARPFPSLAPVAILSTTTAAPLPSSDEASEAEGSVSSLSSATSSPRARPTEDTVHPTLPAPTALPKFPASRALSINRPKSSSLSKVLTEPPPTGTDPTTSTPVPPSDEPVRPSPRLTPGVRPDPPTESPTADVQRKLQQFMRGPGETFETLSASSVPSRLHSTRVPTSEPDPGSPPPAPASPGAASPSRFMDKLKNLSVRRRRTTSSTTTATYPLPSIDDMPPPPAIDLATQLGSSVSVLPAAEPDSETAETPAVSPLPSTTPPPNPTGHVPVPTTDPSPPSSSTPSTAAPEPVFSSAPQQAARSPGPASLASQPLVPVHIPPQRFNIDRSVLYPYNECPPLLIPPDTTLLIFEESADSSASFPLYRGSVGTFLRIKRVVTDAKYQASRRVVAAATPASVEDGRPLPTSPALDIHVPVRTLRSLEYFESVAPSWLLDFLLCNHAPLKEPVKLSFLMRPRSHHAVRYAGDPTKPAPRHQGSIRLVANRLLRVRKVLAYAVEKLEILPPPAAQLWTLQEQDRRRRGIKTLHRPGQLGPDPPLPREIPPEVWLEVLCGDQILPVTATLGTVKRHVWKSSQDIVFEYRYKPVADPETTS
ncbi:hypothetical protein IWQ60_011252, partial [Tieghemiomyces parasiticus]